MYEARLAAIVMAIRDREHQYRFHAIAMIQTRGLTLVLFEQAMMTSDLQIIEDYPEYDPPAPLVITFYWPDTEPQKWDTEFKRRIR